MTVPQPASVMADAKTTMVDCFRQSVQPTSTVRTKARTSLQKQKQLDRRSPSICVVQADVARAEQTLAQLKKQQGYAVNALLVRSPAVQCCCSICPASRSLASHPSCFLATRSLDFWHLAALCGAHAPCRAGCQRHSSGRSSADRGCGQLQECDQFVVGAVYFWELAHTRKLALCPHVCSRCLL